MRRHMGLLARFTSRPVPFIAGTIEPLWRRGDFVSLTVGDEVAVTFRVGRGAVVVPAFALDFVQGCDVFRPMEAHLAQHVERQGWGALQVASLRSWLPKLIDAG